MQAFDRKCETVVRDMEKERIYPQTILYSVYLQNNSKITFGVRLYDRKISLSDAYVVKVEEDEAGRKWSDWKNMIERVGRRSKSLNLYIKDPPHVLLLCKIYSFLSQKLDKTENPYGIESINVIQLPDDSPFISDEDFKRWLGNCVRVVKRSTPMPTYLNVFRSTNEPGEPIGNKRVFDTQKLEFVQPIIKNRQLTQKQLPNPNSEQRIRQSVLGDRDYKLLHPKQLKHSSDKRGKRENQRLSKGRHKCN